MNGVKWDTILKNFNQLRTVIHTSNSKMEITVILFQEGYHRIIVSFLLNFPKNTIRIYLLNNLTRCLK